MKNILILIGIAIVMLSCNSDKIAELETENSELKTSIELCRQEAAQLKAQADIATLRAFEAQKMAEEQYQKAMEASNNSKK